MTYLGDQSTKITLCENKLNVIKRRIIWKLDNYSIRTKVVGDRWTSSPFKFKGFNDCDTQWELRFYPVGVNDTAKGFASFYLNSTICSTNTKAFFEISILGRDDDKFYPYKLSGGAKTVSKGLSNGVDKYLKIDDVFNLSDIIVNDSLTIVCDITLVDTEDQITCLESDLRIGDKLEEPKLVTNFEQVCDDLKNAFTENNKESSDVTIKCEGKEFYCNQFLLAARSPVFKAMFQTNMKEQVTGSIDIDEFTSQVVEKMLLFIYSGAVPDVDKHAKDLLNIAEKYQLQQLKTSLGEKLVLNLNNENCFEYLGLGDLFHVTSLKDAALKLLKWNVKCIMKKESWKKELENLPSSLAWEVMEKVLKE